MIVRRVLAALLVVDLVCAVACLVVLAVGGVTALRVAALLGAACAALFVAVRLRRYRGRP